MYEIGNVSVNDFTLGKRYIDTCDIMEENGRWTNISLIGLLVSSQGQVDNHIRVIW
jgi:hypothetical protein